MEADGNECHLKCQGLSLLPSALVLGMKKEKAKMVGNQKGSSGFRSTPGNVLLFLISSFFDQLVTIT